MSMPARALAGSHTLRSRGRITDEALLERPACPRPIHDRRSCSHSGGAEPSGSRRGVRDVTVMPVRFTVPSTRSEGDFELDVVNEIDARRVSSSLAPSARRRAVVRVHVDHVRERSVARGLSCARSRSRTGPEHALRTFRSTSSAQRACRDCSGTVEGATQPDPGVLGSSGSLNGSRMVPILVAFGRKPALPRDPDPRPRCRRSPLSICLETSCDHPSTLTSSPPVPLTSRSSAPSLSLPIWTA